MKKFTWATSTATCMQSPDFLMKCLGIISVLFVWGLMHPGAGMAEDRSLKVKKAAFREEISRIAEKYIGTPYRLGGHMGRSGTLDNSHLFCLIYFEAAKEAGMEFRGYMPMMMLLKNMVPVLPDEIKNGDLMVLQKGHAAMLYNVKDPHHFDLIYASLKRKQVISFSTNHLAFSVYWLRNLKGYFRLADRMLLD